MPTYRKLHTKILDSYDFAEMPNDFTRVFWMLLIVVVDSEGRAIDSPAWLRSRMFPLRTDVSADQITDAIGWLSQREMIIRYQVDGRNYFYIPKFKTYQSGTEREAKSVLPAPPDLVMSNSGTSQELLQTNSMSSVVVVVSESVIESVDVGVKDNAEFAEVITAFEKNIGAITPLSEQQISDDLKEYGKAFCLDAMAAAVLQNNRKWSYVRGIMKNWKTNGRGGPNGKRNMRALKGADGNIIEVEQ